MHAHLGKYWNREIIPLTLRDSEDKRYLSNCWITLGTRRDWWFAGQLNQPDGRLQTIIQVYCYFYRLSGREVVGLRALGSIGKFHGYTLTLLQGLVNFGLNSAVINKFVFAALLWNKTTLPCLLVFQTLDQLCSLLIWLPNSQFDENYCRVKAGRQPWVKTRIMAKFVTN